MTYAPPLTDEERDGLMCRFRLAKSERAAWGAVFSRELRRGVVAAIYKADEHILKQRAEGRKR